MVINLKSRIADFFLKGDERTILVKKNIVLTFIIRIGSILISLILVPMTITYVSAAQYGVWLTISSIIGWLNFFDIGLGNGLKNKLTQSIALKENNEAKGYVSTAYIAIGAIAILTFSIFSTINTHIKWESILNVKGEEPGALQEIMYIAIGCFCIQFVAQLLNTVLIATHQSAKASLISFFGQIFTILSIYYCIKYQPPNLLTLVSVVASMPVITLIISSLYYYNSGLSTLSPSWKLVNIDHAKKLLNKGAKFFIIQIGALVLFQTNYLIISQLFGPEKVTIYSICYKLFSIIIMVFTIIMTPLWSSFTDAYTKSDFHWLNKTVKKMRRMWIFFSILTICLLGCSSILYEKWLGKDIHIPWLLSICMAVYVIAYIWQMMHVYLLNGMGKIRLQLILVSVSALLNIPIAILMGKRFGLAGIISTSTFFFIAMGIIFSIQCNKILHRQTNNIWNK